MYERSWVASEVHDAPCEDGRPTPRGMCVASFVVWAAPPDDTRLLVLRPTTSLRAEGDPLTPESATCRPSIGGSPRFVGFLRAVIQHRASATAEGKSDAVWSSQGGARDSKWASGTPRRVVTAGLQPARVPMTGGGGIWWVLTAGNSHQHITSR